MKNIKRGSNMLTAFIIYFIIYNTYFGWNDTPINSAEEICDGIGRIMFYAAIFLYTTPIFSLYRRAVWKMDNDHYWNAFDKADIDEPKNYRSTGSESTPGQKH